jgi:hypothetical protein
LAHPFPVARSGGMLSFEDLEVKPSVSEETK